MTGATSWSFRYGPAVLAGPADTVVPGLLAEGPVLLVTDAGVRGLGLAGPVARAIEASGRPLAWFDAVEADPSEATVLACAHAARRHGAAQLVGLGGGSPMDVAKLAAYVAATAEPLESLYGVDRARGRRLPLVLVPTTAGTGSEATGISIVTVDGAVKKGVVSPALLADHAVLDPALTLGLPHRVTAATGIDAMVHAIEAYTSRRLKNPVSDVLARQALALLAMALPRVLADGADAAARADMLLGAHLAGVAFANAPVGGVHALAYPLGGHFHVPHGHSNALMLVPVLRHNLGVAAPLYAELLDCVAPGHEARGAAQRAAAFVALIDRLTRDSGLPLGLESVGVSAADVHLLAREAMLQERLLVNNPVRIDEEDARRLYAQALAA